MRTELELSMAMFAAERASTEDVNDIKMRHQKLIQAKKSGRNLILADLEFHTATATACHNDCQIL